VLEINSTRKKQRGQKRKLGALLKYIDEFEAYKNIDEKYEHFHVPCSCDFINSKKTSSKVKTAFCKKWLKATERFIKRKPSKLPFCKVVSLISIHDLWGSQIKIFYDEDYYNTFWDRKTPEQLWEQITDKNLSFIRERGITTHLTEIGYRETLKDEDYTYKGVLWFYGEL